MVGTIINFVTTNNDVIVAVLGSLILILTALAFYVTYFMKGSPEARAERDIADLEESLRKLIVEIHKSGVATVANASPGAAQVGTTAVGAADIVAAGVANINDVAANSAKNAAAGAQKGTSSGVVAGPGMSGSADPEQIASLQRELDNKRMEVEDLKKRVSGSNMDNSAELLAKIKVLEERLAEYEIIEDDIADLSIFKEENVRLKKELEDIKANKPAAAKAAVAESAPAAVADAPEPAPTPAPDQPADEKEAPAAATSIEATPEEPSADELMAEFDSASEKLDKPAETSASAEEPAPDVFSEFSESASADTESLESFDPDKMLQELHGLSSEAGDLNAVNESTDIDRMSEEAKKL